MVGEVENECFDCKSQPYLLDAGDYAKRELAKDVTAFANAGGGYIFIGFRTEPGAARFGEEVTELRPSRQDLIDPDQHHKVISEWVYPEPKGIGIEWRPHGDKGNGIGVIYVPPQEQRGKPFLIAKTIVGSKSTETLLGYAERKRDSIDPLSVVELHHALRIGMNFEQEMRGRFDNIESVLETFFQTSSEVEAADKWAQELASRIEFALQHDAMHAQRVLILTARPTEPTELKTLFSKQQDSIRRQLENPPSLRSSGWDLGTADQARSIEGRLVRVVNGSRKVMDLYRDGCLIFAGLADARFLAWGTNDGRKLNPLSVIELVLNFTRFYSLVLDDMRERPAEVAFTVELRNMHLAGAKTFLAPYGVKSHDFQFGYGAKEAPADSWSTKVAIKTDQYDADRVAHELVRELYLWFGHEDEVISIHNGRRRNDKSRCQTDSRLLTHVPPLPIRFQVGTVWSAQSQ